MYFSSEHFAYRKLIVYQHARALNKAVYILQKMLSGLYKSYSE